MAKFCQSEILAVREFVGKHNSFRTKFGHVGKNIWIYGTLLEGLQGKSIIRGQNYYFWSKIPLWLNGQNIQHLPELFWPKFLAISPFDCALIKAVNHSWKKNKHPKSLWRLIFHFHLMFLLCSLNTISNPVLVSSATGSLVFVIRFHRCLYRLASWFRWW